MHIQKVWPFDEKMTEKHTVVVGFGVRNGPRMTKGLLSFYMKSLSDSWMCVTWHSVDHKPNISFTRVTLTLQAHKDQSSVPDEVKEQ